MIVAMKKIALFMQAKDAPGAILNLRRLGIVHVEHAQPSSGQDIHALRDELALVGQALEVLSTVGGSGAKESTTSVEPIDWNMKARHIIDLHKRISQLEEFSLTLTRRISQWEQWGDFDPGQILALCEKGIYCQLYAIAAKELKKLPPGIIVKQFFVAWGLAHCALISRQPINIGFKELELPKQGLEKMRRRLAEDERAITVLKKDLHNCVGCYPGLAVLKQKLEKDLTFQEALRGMGEAGVLSFLSGYAPFDAVAALHEAAKKEKWGLMVDEPSLEDNVPTLIRNPRWISIIKPVFKMLEVVPGYQELDTSLWFLIFFSLFFGILIGDAGYGLTYLVLTFWWQKKKGAKVSNANVFLLLYLLSSCAIIWGLLTGSFFGQAWLRLGGIKPFLPSLNNPVTMQTLCFFIGALHLSIAHAWRAALKFPRLACLADIGWICVLWTAFLLARTLILTQPFPEFGKWLVSAGLLLVIFFSHPGRSIFKTLGEGLGTVALSLMNNFTDVVSYVRLFAVGLAGVAIAETTNAMAGGLGSGVIARLAGILIIVFGHALNIVLGPISVLVHGVRLNVLEFSGHASVTWSGQAYKPLAEDTA